jgi:hypothetical protein
VELFPKLIRVERPEVDPGDGRIALEVSQHGRHWVIASGFLRPEGRDHKEVRGRTACHQVLEEGARRRIGPVDVLELERERPSGGRSIEDADEAIEQPCLGHRPRPQTALLSLAFGEELGDHAGQGRSVGPDELLNGCWLELLEQVAQRLDDRNVSGATLAEVEARTKRHSNTSIPGALVPRRKQPSLADAGVTADQDGRRRSIHRRPERVVERRELNGTTDEDGTGDADHVPIIGLPRRVAGAVAGSSPTALLSCAERVPQSPTLPLPAGLPRSGPAVPCVRLKE